MAFKNRPWGFRKDAGSKHLAKLLTPFLLVAVMLLFVDSVASSSRFLHNLPESDIHSSAPVIPGLGSFATHRTLIQRDLLQDTGYKPPKGSGGSGPRHYSPSQP